ncbi:hypothetical protein GBO34_00730 [Roseivirga pacifica]|uniref:hypothetical protein n=1 Tax=Roseivirga pacifica TaxID=1267423 RepID=UPI00209551F5|nr:hypothetical protein [Roseivirga pacifica]MCO6367837.1 hypothetical protein [Roseivirga pacifica]MCO6377209.1 hypothetical protein [Roseivirga pacifica]
MDKMYYFKIVDWRISYNKEVEIKVLPHLKKFIPKFFKQQEPVKVDFNTSMGTAFNSVLRKKSNYRKDRDRYTSSMRFLLNDDLSKLSLQHQYLVQFNVEFDRIFKESMYSWVLAQSNLCASDSQAVRNFLEYYNINEGELSFDSAYTMYNRYKKEYFKNKRAVV